MKRIMTFFLSITMVFILGGCDFFPFFPGGDNSDDEDYYYVSGYVTEYSSNPTNYLADVQYKIRLGSDNRNGDVLLSGYTENATVPSSRSFLTTLEPGVYTIEFSKTGYHTAYLTNLGVDDYIEDAHMMMKPDNVHYTPTTVLDGYEYGNDESLSTFMED